MKPRHFIALSDYTRPELDRILERTASLKRELKEGKLHQTLVGKCVAMIFEKASTRTRVSCQVGISQLGATAIFLPSAELQLARGEPIKDTARVLSRYLDAVVIRANRHEDVLEFARWSSMPVVNGLTDLVHPCQIMADLFTARECGLDLDDFTIAWVGDGNNVANSWINAAALYSFRLRLACPAGYDPSPRVMDFARSRNARVELVRDPLEAARGADLLYTDVWVSMGQENEKAKRLHDLAGYRLDRKLLEAAAPGCKVMHCLPAHRGEEITEEVMEGEASVIFDQAENRLHAQKAILEILIAGE